MIPARANGTDQSNRSVGAATTSNMAAPDQRQVVLYHKNQALVTPEKAPKGALLVSPRQVSQCCEVLCHVILIHE